MRRETERENHRDQRTGVPKMAELYRGQRSSGEGRPAQYLGAEFRVGTRVCQAEESYNRDQEMLGGPGGQGLL